MVSVPHLEAHLPHLHDFPRNSGAFSWPLERDRSSFSLVLLESHCCLICSNGSVSQAVNSFFWWPFLMSQWARARQRAQGERAACKRNGVPWCWSLRRVNVRDNDANSFWTFSSMLESQNQSNLGWKRPLSSSLTVMGGENMGWGSWWHGVNAPSPQPCQAWGGGQTLPVELPRAPTVLPSGGAGGVLLRRRDWRAADGAFPLDRSLPVSCSWAQSRDP